MHLIAQLLVTGSQSIRLHSIRSLARRWLYIRWPDIRRPDIRWPVLVALVGIVSCEAGERPLIDVPDQDPPWQPDSEQQAFLDQLQEDTFRYFWERANPVNGMVPDRAPGNSSASIAAVGFGLTAYIIGVERGFISRVEAAQRTLNTIRFFWEAPQGAQARGVTGHRGFFYHFLNMDDGMRAGQSELSTIDTALLLAGMLTSQSYFDRNDPVENNIRALTDAIYTRIDWDWILSRNNPPLIGHGWYPESGFIPNDWTGYDESMILYILALGGPENPVSPDAWNKYTETYRWMEYYGYEHVNASPLFLHQYSHMYIDFRDIKDDYMRGRGIDYFENSRRATLSQREYAMDNPNGWTGYGENVWGLSACDGPGNFTITVDGEQRQIYGYRARGASALFAVDDGTIAPTAAGGSLPFAPEETVTALYHMYQEYGDLIYRDQGFRDSFNLTFRPSQLPDGWVNSQYLGIDQGPIAIQIENFRNGLIWELTRNNEHIRRGLERAGFSGGWLDD